MYCFIYCINNGWSTFKFIVGTCLFPTQSHSLHSMCSSRSVWLIILILCLNNMNIVVGYTREATMLLFIGGFVWCAQRECHQHPQQHQQQQVHFNNITSGALKRVLSLIEQINRTIEKINSFQLFLFRILDGGWWCC